MKPSDSIWSTGTLAHVGIGDEGIARGIGETRRLQQHVVALGRAGSLGDGPSRSSIFSSISATMPWLLGGSSYSSTPR